MNLLLFLYISASLNSHQRNFSLHRWHLTQRHLNWTTCKEVETMKGSPSEVKYVLHTTPTLDLVIFMGDLAERQ